MDIKDLELSDSDFKLIVDGLDSLPNKDFGGEIIGMMFEGMLTDKSPEAAEKMKRDRELKSAKDKQKKEILIEEIKILQGKLLMFKRWLAQEGALKQTIEILSH